MIVLAALNPHITQGESSIVINEFSVEPEQRIELWNNSTSIVDISNWFIDDAGGTTFFTVPHGTLLHPNSCVVFNENLNLNKSSGDTIRLFDNTDLPTTSSSRLIDNYSYLKSPGINISWLRLPDGGSLWATGSASFGFQNALGISCVVTPTPTPTTTPTRIPTQTPTTTPVPDLTGCIHLSEVMINPLPDNHEWIELYNSCPIEAVLSTWYADDQEDSGSAPKSFSLTVSSRGFQTIEFVSSMFNNDYDSIRILDQNKNVIATIEYNSSMQGKSFSNQDINDDSNWCITEPSYGLVNTMCINQATTSESALAVSSITTLPSPHPTLQIFPTINEQTYYLSIDRSEILGVSTNRNLGKTRDLKNILSYFLIIYLLILLQSLTLPLLTMKHYLHTKQSL
ncbi:MAG: lamin tail domain-containing protein [Patescibacteria group bacterium]